MERTFDPVQVDVWRHLLASVAEEMGVTLERTAYSPNVKERLDYSCALFDSSGRLLAQAAHIPVHLGAMPLMMQTLLPSVPWRPGSMWLCNDPRAGGTHLPDITLVAPVYASDEPVAAPIGFVAARAHHADIGGITPGSLPLSTEIFHEGLILPPVPLVEAGAVREEILRLVCANSRTPAERRGDLAAQVAAAQTGAGRLLALVARYGRAEFEKRAGENIAYAVAAIRAALRALPAGVYTAVDYLDGDGVSARDLRIAVTATIRPDGTLLFDFHGTDKQTSGSVNATEAITRSACYYVVRCLADGELPTNAGCFEPVTVVAPEGTLVNARFPAAVAAGNVETSQRIVDVTLAALAQAAPDRIPAASQGTMNNLTIGGYDPIRKRAFAYYETLAGGAGASPQRAGESAVHTHMTNTRNTPVEVLESHYPLQVLAYRIRGTSGGAGAHSGGNGLIRSLALLAEAQVSLLAERRNHAPQGRLGGAPGSRGADSVCEPNCQETDVSGKWSRHLPAGSVITIRTPGGGGWGGPPTAEPVVEKHEPESVAHPGDRAST